MIDGDNADEGSQWVPADGAQPGQLSKEGACGHSAYAGNRLQKRLGLPLNRRALDRLADVVDDLGELFLV